MLPLKHLVPRAEEKSTEDMAQPKPLLKTSHGFSKVVDKHDAGKVQRQTAKVEQFVNLRAQQSSIKLGYLKN